LNPAIPLPFPQLAATVAPRVDGPLTSFGLGLQDNLIQNVLLVTPQHVLFLRLVLAACIVVTGTIRIIVRRLGSLRLL
jgi:hypothetical protein